MSDNELISVIVPIYKVEKYLKKCVDSIINQTYKNLEIILVDDGSPDNCPKICDEYAKQDSRIKVIHLENGGAGRARNIGYSFASGEFISFIDSDDVISCDFYEYLYGLFETDVDITECEYIEFDTEEVDFSVNEKNKIEKYSMTDAMDAHIKDKMFKQVIWNKLYRRKVADDVKFPENSKIDDEYWTYKVIANANNLIHSSKVLYAYRQQEKSVMSSLSTVDRIGTIEPKALRAEFIRERIPMLYDSCVYNLWGSCLYQYQLVLRDDKKNSKKILDYSKKMFKEFPIKINKSLSLTFKEKIWLIMTKLTLKKTCQLRNLLKIGL